MYGVGLAVKEPIGRKSVDTHQSIDERLMRFELTCECVAVNLSITVASAPTESNLNTELKEEFRKKFGHLVGNEGMSVRTGRCELADWKENWLGATMVACLEHTDVMSSTITANAC